MASHPVGAGFAFPSHSWHRTGTGDAMLVGPHTPRLLQPFGLRNDVCDGFNPSFGLRNDLCDGFNPSLGLRNDVCDGFDPRRLGTKGHASALARRVRNLQRPRLRATAFLRPIARQMSLGAESSAGRTTVQRQPRHSGIAGRKSRTLSQSRGVQPRCCWPRLDLSHATYC